MPFSLILIIVLTFLLASSLAFYVQYALLRRRSPLSDRLADLEKTNPFKAYGESILTGTTRNQYRKGF